MPAGYIPEMIYMVDIISKGAKPRLESKARLNHVQLSMMDIKGCSRETSSFVDDVYPDGPVFITESYSNLERV